MKKLLIITATVLYIQILNSQTVTDIDGNIYNTVTIGKQKWMKENLKTTHFQNGDSIGTTYPATLDYSGITNPKYQWAYEGKDSLVAIYGRLYTWYAATDSRNVCPTGWHLPTRNEFVALDNFLGGASIAKGKLKETGTVHWSSPNTDATDAVGFTGLPGGSHWPTGEFVDMGIAGHHWAANLEAPGWAYRMLLTNNIMDAQYHINSADPTIGWSVRCIEDPIPDSAKYFGQTTPGDTAILFAPGIISLPDRSEAQIAFSPDGKEIYLVADEGIFMQYKDNKWGPQIAAPISGDAPFYSLDGKKIYFTIYTWNNNHTGVTSSDLYEVNRNDGIWGQDIPLQAPINSTSFDGGYSQTADSIIYFHSNRSGNYEIWRINPITKLAETLGSTVNSTSASSPSVASDGSYIVFGSDRAGSIGNEDLYICFKKENDSWTKPINLNSGGSEINIANHSQIYPSLSPDGKYLFFNRHNWVDLLPDIYWVSTKIFVGLKKQAFAPKLNKQIPAMNITTDSTINYVIPENTFTCEYGTNKLKYTATLKNGSALPDWLHFDPTTRTLSGKPTQAETDTLTITATNSDKMSATCNFLIRVTENVGIGQLDGKKIELFPNPTNGEINISFGCTIKKAVVEIYNFEGQQIFSKIYLSRAFATIDLTGNPSGLYLVKLTADSEIFTKKINLE